MEQKKPIILVIDDEESIRDSCFQIIVKDGYQAETAKNGTEGLEKIRNVHPDMVLVDLKMPGKSGNEVLEELRTIDPHIIPVVITGYGTVDSAVEAMKSGAFDFVQKPFTPEELRKIIRRSLERRNLIQEKRSFQRLDDQEYPACQGRGCSELENLTALERWRATTMSSPGIPAELHNRKWFGRYAVE